MKATGGSNESEIRFEPLQVQAIKVVLRGLVSLTKWVRTGLNSERDARR
jgi:hypothetical protein